MHAAAVETGQMHEALAVPAPSGAGSAPVYSWMKKSRLPFEPSVHGKALPGQHGLIAVQLTPPG